MSSYQEKITNLVDMVSTCCNSGDFSTLIDTIRTESEASLEIWVDMEIVFRRIAIQFGARNLSHEVNKYIRYDLISKHICRLITTSRK